MHNYCSTAGKLLGKAAFRDTGVPVRGPKGVHGLPRKSTNRPPNFPTFLLTFLSDYLELFPSPPPIVVVFSLAVRPARLGDWESDLCGASGSYLLTRSVPLMAFNTSARVPAQPPLLLLRLIPRRTGGCLQLPVACFTRLTPLRNTRKYF